MTVFSWPHGHSGEFRDDLLTPEPEFQSTEIDRGDEFLLMACDGLWDVLGKDEAVEHARKFFDEVKSLSAVNSPFCCCCCCCSPLCRLLMFRLLDEGVCHGYEKLCYMRVFCVLNLGLHLRKITHEVSRSAVMIQLKIVTVVTKSLAAVNSPFYCCWFCPFAAYLCSSFLMKATAIGMTTVLHVCLCVL